jgi:sarcosine oxidase subunit beta
MEEGPSENLNSNINFLEKYAREIVNTLPTLSSVKIMKQWASSYIVSPDHHPILGPQEIPNLIMGCGYSSH